MRKGILAIAAAGSVFAITAAGATGLTLTGGTSAANNIESHASVSVSTSVCTGTPAISYTYNGAVTTITNITGLTCSTPATGFKYVFSVALNGGTATTKDVTAAVLVGATTDVTLDSAYAVGTPLTSVALDITVAAV